MKVLYAGIRVDLKRLLRAFLMEYGHELRVVSNGLGCISCLREEPIDILVLDWHLLWGGSDGVLALMREASPELQIPTFMVPGPKSTTYVYSSLGCQLFKPAKLTRDLMPLLSFFVRMITPDRSVQPIWDSQPYNQSFRPRTNAPSTAHNWWGQPNNSGISLAEECAT